MSVKLNGAEKVWGTTAANRGDVRCNSSLEKNTKRKTGNRSHARVTLIVAFATSISPVERQSDENSRGS